ncbi:MAG: hypothetical protein LBQ15_05920 [Clostridium sp.]|jgi:hypothetical protein|nr:hypothetical protein [Clostridium sp.]
MSNFEKKFGKYAVKNLSLVLILCYAAGFLIQNVNSVFLEFLTLNPYQILHGQIWRLVTWVLVPPSGNNLFTMLIMLLFYYSIGTSLERTWGVYRYNLYLFTGMVFTVVGSFAATGAAYLFFGETVGAAPVAALYFNAAAKAFSTYYINMSIFLAYAATFPEAQVLLMFIIPIKVKWLGIVYAGMLVLEFFQGVGEPVLNLFYRTAIAASLLNFLLFWFRSKNRMHLSPKQMKRRQQFKQEVRRNPKITRHKCAVCGQSEEDDPTLEFRFCSKCNGNYEYCQHHLFTHEHVQ